MANAHNYSCGSKNAMESAKPAAMLSKAPATHAPNTITDGHFPAYAHCTLCPRQCGANRYSAPGFCRAGTLPKLARAALHYFEEPCISGTCGSGAVFFSNCTLRCVFCQNYTISAGGFGREITSRQLADTFLRLEQEGAANINLVTATHYLPSVLAALDLVRHKLSIPVVYNCGGYEREESIRALSGYVDIYLPDLKYSSTVLSGRFSAAPDYADFAFPAIREMLRQCGIPGISLDAIEASKQSDRSAAQEISGTRAFAPAANQNAAKNNAAEKTVKYSEALPAVSTDYVKNGLLKRGVIIRHMVLPGHRNDSLLLLSRMKKELPQGQFLISLMSQYTPFYHASDYAELNRRLTSYEYDKVLAEALRLGFDGYMQEKSSAKEEYTPSFRLEGVPLPDETLAQNTKSTDC